MFTLPENINTTKFGFSKKEKLCSQKVIAQLFKNGKSFAAYPFRVVWNFHSNQEIETPAQVSVSVSKRNFKRAVKRNRIKRQMREAYRHNKHFLYSFLNENNSKLAVMFIYISKQLCDSSVIVEGMQNALKKLNNEIERAINEK